MRKRYINKYTGTQKKRALIHVAEGPTITDRGPRPMLFCSTCFFSTCYFFLTFSASSHPLDPCRVPRVPPVSFILARGFNFGVRVRRLLALVAFSSSSPSSSGPITVHYFEEARGKHKYPHHLIPNIRHHQESTSQYYYAGRQVSYLKKTSSLSVSLNLPLYI